MWRGRMLQILGLMLIVTAFGHYREISTSLINATTGLTIALIGSTYWPQVQRRAIFVNALGLTLLLLALIPPLQAHATNHWLAGCGGAVVLFTGWRITISESGGPWRLKDRPVF